MTTLHFTFTALALTLLPPALIGGRATAQEPDLPPAEEILTRYIEVTGGEDAYRALTNRKITGTVEFTEAGIKGEMTVFQAEPVKMHTVLSLENIGDFVQGTNGEVAWELNPLTGNRELEGEEKASFLREATFNADLKWRELYETVETTGAEEVDGTPCYEVVLTPSEGHPVTSYYARDSGLLVKTSTTTPTPMGDVPIEVIVSDFREVDGITLPFTSTQTVLTQKVKTTFQSVEHNIEIPDSTFDVPEPIREQRGNDR